MYIFSIMLNQQLLRYADIDMVKLKKWPDL